MAPVTRRSCRCCQACGQPTKEESPGLCRDCLLAVNLAAVAEEEDALLTPDVDGTDEDVVAATPERVDEAVTSIFLTLTSDMEEKFRRCLTEGRLNHHSVLRLQVLQRRQNETEPMMMHCDLVDVQSTQLTSVTYEHRSSGVPVVTPEKEPKRARDTAASNPYTTTCEDCQERTVSESYMKYCKRCYAQRCQKARAEHGDDTSSARAALPFHTGKCRLCTGAVSTHSFEYCGKCYAAKLRDDARRAEQHALRAAAAKRRAVQGSRVPFVCIDCGDRIPGTDDWKTKCAPCFARNPVKRPRLLRNPPRVLFVRSPK